MAELIARYWHKCERCDHRFIHDEREADCPRCHVPAVLYGVQEHLPGMDDDLTSPEAPPPPSEPPAPE